MAPYQFQNIIINKKLPLWVCIAAADGLTIKSWNVFASLTRRFDPYLSLRKIKKRSKSGSKNDFLLARISFFSVPPRKDEDPLCLCPEWPDFLQHQIFYHFDIETYKKKIRLTHKLANNKNSTFSTQCSRFSDNFFYSWVNNFHPIS